MRSHAAGAPIRTPLGNLTVLPQSDLPAAFDPF